MIYSGFTRNQDSVANRTDYVELGLACAEVCKAIERGTNGRRTDDLSQSVFGAIEQLTTSVEPGCVFRVIRLPSSRLQGCG